MFLIIYLWLTFFINSLFLTFLISILATCVLNYAWMYFVYRRKKVKNRTRAQTQHLNQVMLQLKFMTHAATLAFFTRAFKEKFKVPTIEQPPTETPQPTPTARAYFNRIAIQNNETKSNFFPLFHINISKEDIIACLNKCKPGERCVIAAYDFDIALMAFFESLDIDIVFMDAARIYDELLEPTKTFPRIVIQEKKSVRLTLRRLGALMFTRKKVKGYIFVGIIILLTSLIIRPSIYYIVMATIVFGIALISLMRPAIPAREKIWG